MHLGLFLGAFVPPSTPAFLATAARAAEARGFHSLWVGEHVVLFDEYAKEYPYATTGAFPVAGEGGMTEPFTTLSYLAGQTSRIRLGTGVCLVPQRNPLYTAKEVANVDWLSGGRFDFGIGVGWMREEFAALGVPWERRGARADEYIELMRRLWCDPLSSHEGEFWTLPPSRAFPKPVQAPHPPIHVGGESDVAIRRVVRLGADWLPFNVSPEVLAARRRRLAELLEGTGRSIDDVFVTASPDRDSARGELAPAYADAGADQLLVHLRRRVTTETVEAALDELADAYGLEPPA
ncbi:MAG: TIGR03619 family F420-dependent LLM class oxidoreductase [Acidimicrobiia bacterium]|nr:TIGR03619 family F420-dependent LLM class oxidoreductase [Acidimicrobiia bacterium]